MFEKFSFSEKQTSKYRNSAIKDLKIANGSKIAEVIFKFSYDALLKLAITICAENGLRIKARQGHHVELINKLSELLNNGDIKIIGQEMRAKRNLELYGGGAIISQKEAAEFLGWIKEIFKETGARPHKKRKLL